MSTQTQYLNDEDNYILTDKFNRMKKAKQILNKHLEVEKITHDLIGMNVYATCLEAIREALILGCVSYCLVDKTKADEYNTDDCGLQLYVCECGNTSLFEGDNYCAKCGALLEFK